MAFKNNGINGREIKKMNTKALKIIENNILENNDHNDAGEFNAGFLYGLYVSGIISKTEWAEASKKYCKQDLRQEWVSFDKYEENRGGK